ncbi:hypothetical protein DEU56DRAFT_872776 [Suillus clintonianus]|uniref:uncharacterized protein n=1 Tax=Suillus clintonianus TaxID=1904413 RepID=UPI001B8793D0|nr:uncharacterized protein DEU56DRAFT_872776 [Suillus clintonianus]KAG2127505.1 hypothetical protein DEU56DRAFT_872776 [Suillus clintonianus]
MSVSPSYEPDNQSAVPGEDFCDLSYDFGEPDPFVLLDDSENTPGRKRMPADDLLLIWMNERDLFLAELLRHEGRGGYTSDVCPGCPCPTSTPPRYRCQDCLDSQLYCGLCIIQYHIWLPTHHIEEWTGQFFQRISLKTMGLRVQLGHTIGERCILPKKAFNDEFVLIDTNGVHEIGLDFCGCTTSQTHTKQLLRAGWYPSTSTDPRLAATFRVLHHYHVLSFESKTSAYEFYHSLVRLTDNTGLTRQKDHYESFMRMIRQWRHLVMLKRSGRGHDPSGVAGTSEDQCAVLCPASIDANFRLKRRAVSSDETDPSLSQGWAYFIEEKSYKSYILDRIGDVQEKSTCSNHNAVNMAETKSSQGLAATGVGTVDCARHNMKRPNGVGDLQKGEKYLNMDYLFFSSLRHSTVDALNVSYDIACQWHKHLWSRMLSLPPSHHLNYVARTIRFFVPKFHLPAHVSKCQTIFSFNFTRFVGRTDGEAPERGWSNINPVASSTKAMGPGCRRDTLDDHFGDWNWKKVVGLGSFLLLKIKEAQTEKAEHGAAFEEFDSVISSENRMAWKAEMEAWEENPNNTTVTNPLEPKGITITQASARLSLAQLEAEELERGVDLSLHPDVSPSVLVASGMDLEEEQRRLKVVADNLGVHATDTQKLSVLRTRISLRRKIDSWRQTQLLYVPSVQVLVTASATSDLDNAELIKLWLPSALNGNACDPHLQHIEWELRFAQAHDALEELRQCLRVHCSLLNFKREWIRGQGANTRAQNALTRVHARQAACVKRYRTAWGALKRLAPILKKDLSDDDVKPLIDPFATQGEGRRRLTWIWMMDGYLLGVRVEWCKSRARALRWAEEVDLLQEEMRRVLQFFNWQANWWEGQGVLQVYESAPCNGEEQGTAARREAAARDEGLCAYASQQANIRHRLTARFCSIWAPFISPQDILGNPTAMLPIPGNMP